MTDRKAELIRSAILDRLGMNIAVFSSEDILAVAGISADEIEELVRQLEDNVATITTPEANKRTPKNERRQPK